jgi:hypothetical protein
MGSSKGCGDVGSIVHQRRRSARDSPGWPRNLHARLGERRIGEMMAIGTVLA